MNEFHDDDRVYIRSMATAARSAASPGRHGERCC